MPGNREGLDQRSANSVGLTEAPRLSDQDHNTRPWVLLPIPPKEKGPKLPGWNDPDYAPPPVPDGWNRGLRLDGWTELDADSPRAVDYWEQNGPDTPFVHESRPGHRGYWYRGEALAPGVYHWYLPDGERGGEVRVGHKCQVVIPPSVHPTGSEYKWIGAGGELTPGSEAPTITVEQLPPGKAVEAIQRRVGSEDPAVAWSVERCPAHDDGRPSLALGHLESGLLVAHCYAGCDWRDVNDALVAEGRYKREDLWPKKKRTAKGGNADELRLDDEGNAARIVAKYGHQIRYAEGVGWMIWDGRRLLPVSEEYVAGMVTLWDTFDADLLACKDPDTARAICSWRNRSASHGRRIAALKTAAANPAIRVEAGDLDADPDVINTPGGLVDLRTGQVRPSTITDLVTKITAVPYDPEATCPTWDRFLAEIMPADDMRDLVQRLLGYGITGHTREHALPFFHGVGANGKSTLVDSVLDIVGEYASVALPGLVVTKRGRDAHPEALAGVHGRRIVVAAESEENGQLDAETVKRLTGGDTITARHLYQRQFSFRPTHLLLLMSNHKPIVTSTDYGTWRRLLLVPFSVTIPREQWDLTLRERIMAEAPGVLTWMVRGAIKWYRDGLKIPADVAAATETYRSDQDILAKFIDDCFIIEPTARIPLADLYESYKEWCAANGHQPMSSTALGRKMEERGYPAVKSNGARYRQGLRRGRQGQVGTGFTSFRNSIQEAPPAIGDSSKPPKSVPTCPSPVAENTNEPLIPDEIAAAGARLSAKYTCPVCEWPSIYPVHPGCQGAP